MKSFACVLFLLVQISFSGFAQDTPDEAIKNKIRDIKLAEEFIFAEATSLTSLGDAQKAAEEALHTETINWMVDSGKDKESAENTWNSIKGSYLTLSYQLISLHKAFTYIPKSDVANGAAHAPINEPTVQVAQQETETVAQPVPEPAAPQDKADVASVTPVIQPAVTPTPVAEMPLINLDDFDISEEEMGQPLHQDVNALLALDTYQSVIFYLDAMQDDGRLVYGRIATLTSPDQAYLIIVKDGKLITVLDKGKGERMNLKTKQMEAVNTYRGYAIIWMKTFK